VKAGAGRTPAADVLPGLAPLSAANGAPAAMTAAANEKPIAVLIETRDITPPSFCRARLYDLLRL
jgi:hypothetical protein